MDDQSRFNRIERAIFSGQYKFVSSTTGKRDLYKAKESKAMELETKLSQWLVDTKEESGTATKLDKDAR